MSQRTDQFKRPPASSLKLPDSSMQVDTGSGATASAMSPLNNRGEEVKIMLSDLNNTDPAAVIRGLNQLSIRSFSNSELQQLNLETYPAIIVSLGNLLNNLNPIGNMVFSHENPTKQLIQSGCIHELLLDGWDFVPRSLMSLSTYNSFKVNAVAVEDNQFVVTILNIIKNFSLETSNEQLLACAEPIIRHCVSLIWLMDVHNNFLNNHHIQSDVIQYCLDIIVNLANRIDISSRKRTQNSSWMEDTLAKGYPKTTLHFRMSSHISEETSTSYTTVSASLLPLIHMHIKASTSRTMVLKCLEILTKLASSDNQYYSPLSPDNSDYILKCPDSFYESLVELLCTSVTSLEPLAPSLDRNKPPAYVGASFFSDICDIEVQGAALDAIFAMCMPEKGTFTSKIQLRFAAVPKIFPLLLRISEGGRNTRSLSLLNLFGNRIENQKQVLGIHINMIQSAYDDDSLAEFASTNTLIYADNDEMTRVRDEK